MNNQEREELKEETPEMNLEDLLAQNNELQDIRKKIRRMQMIHVIALILFIGIRLSILYGLSLLGFGFFFSELVVENKFIVFGIAGVVSLAIFMSQVIGLKLGKSFTPRLIALAFVIALFVFVDWYCFKVFRFSVIWVFYFASVIVIYLCVDYKLSS